MAESLKQKTATSFFWSTLQSGVMQVLNLVFGVVLSRLLDAPDYGMVGVLAIFQALASSLQESGFIVALGRKQEVSHRDYNAVYWCSMGISLLLYAVLFLVAPLIADFYHNEALIPLARYQFLGFVIGSFGIVPSAILYRNMMVRERAIGNITALLVSGTVGIIMAWRGFAHWGIATQSIVYILVTCLCNTFFTRWRPTFQFDFSPLRELFAFSSKLLLTNVFTIFNNYLVEVVLGKFYSVHSVGYFTQARKWNGMGNGFITGAVANVAIPTFREVQNDEERELRIFRKMLRFTAFLSFPAMLGLALVAPQLIEVFITAKWLQSSVYLRILAVGSAFAPITYLYTQFLLSKGKGGTYLWNSVAQALMTLGILLYFRQAPIEEMLIYYTAANVLWLGVWHYLLQRIFPFTTWHLFADVLPFFLISAVFAGFAGWVTASMESVLLCFLCRVLLMGGLYLFTMWVLRVKAFQDCIEFAQRWFQKK